METRMDKATEKTVEESTEALPLPENRMGTMPEGKLLWRMGVPLSLSMLIQALYNIVDSIFVARLSETALTAVTLAYPLYMLQVSVAVGTGVGINSLISRRLGARRHAEADASAANGLFVMALSCVAFMLFGFFGVRPFFNAFTDIPELRQMGTTYLSICCTMSIGLFMQIFCERIMQAQGKNLYAMLMQAFGAVINIIFDPILIFGLLGFPKLGIAGAAYATVGGQIIACLFSFLLVCSKRSEVRLRLARFRPSAAIIRDIYAVGLPSAVMQSITTVMNLVLNGLLIGFSTTAVAVLGAYFKVQSFALMPLFGVTNASMSIMAYNYGAGNRQRLMRTYTLTLITSAAIMALFTAVFELFPLPILSMFSASSDMLDIGRAAFTIIPLALPIAAYNIATSTLFQAVGNGMYSMWMSLVRQLFVLVPAAWALARVTGTVDGVWWAFVIAEVVSVALCLRFYARTYRDRILTL